MAADLPERHVGRFAVSASSDAVERYGRAVLSMRGEDGRSALAIPASFPIIWLGRDDIKAALQGALGLLAGAGDRAPVHLSQSIVYDRSLALDTPYWLDLGLSGPDERGVVRIEASIVNEQLAPQARLSGRLAFVPVAPHP